MVERTAPVELALIGAGPTASSLLERLAANVDPVLGPVPLRIHLVDAHRAGTGRVWRPDLDPLLWMNSLAEDVTMFTDASVRCEGPLRPGPSLIEWAHQVPDDELAALAPPELVREIRGLTGASFPTRRVQSAYLTWFHRRVLASLPDHVEIVRHGARAVDLRDDADGRQVVTLDGVAEPLVVDVAVLALGHLDAEPAPHEAARARFAAEHGLAYLPPGHTAEQDLSLLAPGADVIVAGFGQAFTDLLVLVTEGRGGRFVERTDGTLRYEPSGREPVLHVGSRRGVPYRSKPDYRLQAPLAPLPHFLDDAGIDALLARPGPIEFFADVLPLLEKEAGWAYYHELFHAHPERTVGGWDAFAAGYTAAGTDAGALAAAVERAVPADADRFSIARLDRPLAGVRLDSVAALQAWMVDHVGADVARRTDASFSADLGAFLAMLWSFGPLARVTASGRLTRRSKVEGVSGWWFSFFMYYASGPPPARLRQCLALAEAGLLRFVGASMTVEADAARGRFVARSATHPDEVVGTALADARIASPTVSRSADALVRRLHARGELCEEVVVDGDWSANTGKVVVVGADLRLADRDRVGHPRRHALGVFTNRPAAGAFARPRTNALAFRQNDLVARSVLATLADVAAAAARADDSLDADAAARPA